jgi:Leu/Phe-tRNA-protein transferase
MHLRYTSTGLLLISPDDDCKAIVNAMLITNYDEDFCLAVDFDTYFIARLMEAGFLVMSTVIEDENGIPVYILLPKLHLERSALFFEKLHVKKSIRKYINKYKLKANVDFDLILNRCLEKHGDDWLTPPLVDCIKKIRENTFPQNPDSQLPTTNAYPTSFGLYRDNQLVAGEFGVVCGKVYTSYSGYYDEDNAGTVQIILTTRYLQEHGFSFFDLGMPLDYKTGLGALNISPLEFVKWFRKGQVISSS